jgi:hypothetical protein
MSEEVDEVVGSRSHDDLAGLNPVELRELFGQLLPVGVPVQARVDQLERLRYNLIY